MFVKEGLYECHCHNVSVLRLSMKRLMLAFMSCYKMSCYHHQRFCLARCGQKGCLIGTCKKKWSSKCIFMLAIKSFCVCVLSLCVQSSQNYGCKLNYRADTFSDVMFYNCFHFHVSTKYIIFLLWSSGKGKGKGWTQEGHWKVIYGWWMVDGGIPFPDALH